MNALVVRLESRRNGEFLPSLTVGKPGKHSHNANKNDDAALRCEPVRQRPPRHDLHQVMGKKNKTERRSKPHQQQPAMQRHQLCNGRAIGGSVNHQ